MTTTGVNGDVELADDADNDTTDAEGVSGDTAAAPVALIMAAVGGCLVAVLAVAAMKLAKRRRSDRRDSKTESLVIRGRTNAPPPELAANPIGWRDKPRDGPGALDANWHLNSQFAGTDRSLGGESVNTNSTLGSVDSGMFAASGPARIREGHDYRKTAGGAVLINDALHPAAAAEYETGGVPRAGFATDHRHACGAPADLLYEIPAVTGQTSAGQDPLYAEPAMSSSASAAAASTAADAVRGRWQLGHDYSTKAEAQASGIIGSNGVYLPLSQQGLPGANDQLYSLPPSQHLDPGARPVKVAAIRLLAAEGGGEVSSGSGDYGFEEPGAPPTYSTLDPTRRTTYGEDADYEATDMPVNGGSGSPALDRAVCPPRKRVTSDTGDAYATAMAAQGQRRQGTPALNVSVLIPDPTYEVTGDRVAQALYQATDGVAEATCPTRRTGPARDEPDAVARHLFDTEEENIAIFSTSTAEADKSAHSTIDDTYERGGAALVFDVTRTISEGQVEIHEYDAFRAHSGQSDVAPGDFVDHDHDDDDGNHDTSPAAPPVGPGQLRSQPAYSEPISAEAVPAPSAPRGRTGSFESGTYAEAADALGGPDQPDSTRSSVHYETIVEVGAAGTARSLHLYSEIQDGSRGLGGGIVAPGEGAEPRPVSAHLYAEVQPRVVYGSVTARVVSSAGGSPTVSPPRSAQGSAAEPAYGVVQLAPKRVPAAGTGGADGAYSMLHRSATPATEGGGQPVASLHSGHAPATGTRAVPPVLYTSGEIVYAIPPGTPVPSETSLPETKPGYSKVIRVDRQTGNSIAVVESRSERRHDALVVPLADAITTSTADEWQAVSNSMQLGADAGESSPVVLASNPDYAVVRGSSITPDMVPNSTYGLLGLIAPAATEVLAVTEVAGTLVGMSRNSEYAGVDGARNHTPFPARSTHHPADAATGGGGGGDGDDGGGGDDDDDDDDGMWAGDVSGASTMDRNAAPSTYDT